MTDWYFAGYERKGMPVSVAIAAPAWTFTDNPAGIVSGASANTFTSVNLGTASSGRLIVVLHSSTDTVATGCTIGGVTATKAVEESTILSGFQIWYANVPTGSTGDIVLTAGSAMNNAIIIVGALTGVASIPTNTNTSTPLADPSPVTITVPATGFGIAGYYGSGIGGTWNNATLDASSTISSVTISMAHTGTVGLQTPEYTASGAAGHNVAAAWGP